MSIVNITTEITEYTEDSRRRNIKNSVPFSVVSVFSVVKNFFFFFLNNA